MHKLNDLRHTGLESRTETRGVNSLGRRVIQDIGNQKKSPQLKTDKKFNANAKFLINKK